MPQDPDAIVGFTPEEFESGINLIFYLTMAIIPFNLSGSFYVLYRVLAATLQARPRAIPASLRLPFYIVFIDTFCSLTFTAEMIHLYIMRRTPEPPFSQILGGCVTFIIICNFVLITQAAFNSWYRVVRKKPVDTGPYEWKLLLPTLLVPSIVVGVFIYVGALGSNNYISWIHKSAKEAAAFVGIMVILSMFAIWYFYVSIMMEIFKVSRGSFLNTVISYRPTKNALAVAAQAAAERAQYLGGQVDMMDDSRNIPTSDNQRSGNSTTSQLTAIERQAIIKICMYMMACFIQYLPGCPYALSFLAPTQPYGLYISALISINSGGIVNATALILNEGWGRKPPAPSMTSSTVWIPGAASANNSSVASKRSDLSIVTANGATQSWGHAPSFRNIPMNNLPPRGTVSVSFGSHATTSMMEPHEYAAASALYQTHSRDPLRSKPTGMSNVSPKNTNSSFDAIWERHIASQVASGPAIAPWQQQAGPNPPLQYQQRQPNPKRNSFGVDAPLQPRRSSEYVAPTAIVDIGSSAIMQAYANMPQSQQQRGYPHAGNYHG
ncbi:hypothetical protein BJ742DRAFT_792277 [Cladochytrium replicatum]|nr:hypothetical protein BJ742DRAFT_792277 [Cladochytrium replicatum]